MQLKENRQKASLPQCGSKTGDRNRIGDRAFVYNHLSCYRLPTTDDQQRSTDYQSYPFHLCSFLRYLISQPLACKEKESKNRADGIRHHINPLKAAAGDQLLVEFIEDAEGGAQRQPQQKRARGQQPVADQRAPGQETQYGVEEKVKYKTDQRHPTHPHDLNALQEDSEIRRRGLQRLGDGRDQQDQACPGQGRQNALEFYITLRCHAGDLLMTGYGSTNSSYCLRFTDVI